MQIINDLGIDPNNNAHNIFEVNFISENFIDAAYINGGVAGDYEIRVGAEFATDCTNGQSANLWIVPVTAFGFTGESGNNPCNRNEKSFFELPGVGGNGLNFLEVYGYDPSPATCYSGSFITPHLIQIQYNVDGGLWTNTFNVTPNVPITLSGWAFYRAADYGLSQGLPAGNHTIGIRYRNWRYDIFTGNWELPEVTGTSPSGCYSKGNVNFTGTEFINSTYTYEYFFCDIP